ncbi:MAG: DUF3472 domain-containing protein [Oscillospiraceae bacterium]|nr:DUF3472 domain-containing protein [Oscillospiraceae bacterium]
MHRLISVSLGVVMVLLLTLPATAQDWLAPALYDSYGPGDTRCDIIMVDFAAEITPPATYYAIHCWGGGIEGSGYAGFQQVTGNDASGRRTLHFSLWDPVTPGEITAEYVSPNTVPERFGGEGTGLKCATNYAWRTNSWYTMVIRNWKEDGRTRYGQWVRDNEQGTWLLTAIMDYPAADTLFYGDYAFIEDWAGNGLLRRQRMQNAYGRDDSTKSWLSWGAHPLSSQGDTMKHWDAGTSGSDYVWFQSGGTQDPTVPLNPTFQLSQPAEPNMGTPQLVSLTASQSGSTVNVSWAAADKSSPQFRASLEFLSSYGQVLRVVDNKAFVTSYSGGVVSGATHVRLTYTDLFDQTTTMTTAIDGAAADHVVSGGGANVEMRGLGDWLFATADIGAAAATLTVRTNAGAPHVYFTGTYASISVYSSAGQLKFSRAWAGVDDHPAQTQTAALAAGDKVVITHLEPTGGVGRLRLIDKATGTNLPVSTSVTYAITGGGDTGGETGGDTGVDTGDGTGSGGANVEMRGLGDWLFATADIDAAAKTLTVRTNAGQPHVYFAETYASLSVYSSAGQRKFSRTWAGKTSYAAQTQTAALAAGDKVVITHLEPTGGVGRLRLIDKATGTNLPVSTSVTYTVS